MSAPFGGFGPKKALCPVTPLRLAMRHSVAGRASNTCSSSDGIASVICSIGAEVVEDPDRASVRGEDEIVVARMDGDVVDRHRRQVEFQPRPVAALIVRNEQPALRAEEEELRIAEMLADDVDRAGVVGDAAADRLPGRAVVGRHENVDAEVVAAMAVERGVRRPFVEARGDDAADVDALLRRRRSSTSCRRRA